MPITLDGSGTITGLSAGGLPDSSVTTSEIAAAAVTAAKLDGAQTGTAPIYGARAWVNFNGTGTIAVRASGNVSSLTDNGVGRYSVNFTTALPNANYAISVTGTRSTGWAPNIDDAITPTTSSAAVCTNNGNGNADSTYVSVAIFG